MALARGTDFLLIDQVAYVGCEGTGKSCLAATRNLLLMVPVETQVVVERKLRTTVWNIGGIPPADAVLNEALKDDSDLESLESFLRSVPGVIEPSILHDLTCISRLRVRTGFFSRGIYLSHKETGSRWRGYALKKQEAIQFKCFFTGHPVAVF